MVLEFADGPCLALEIASKDPDANAYQQLRELCGPADTVRIFVFNLDCKSRTNC